MTDTVNELTTPAAVTTEQPESGPTSKYARLTLSDIELILRLQAEGCTQQQIADVVKCSRSTVCETLQRIKDTPTLVQALAKSEAVPMLQRWITASKQAAKRGDHRPAREFIELAAPELRPATGNSAGGVGVTIVIGQPGQPLALPVIDLAPQPATLSPSISTALHNVTVDSKAVDVV